MFMIPTIISLLEVVLVFFPDLLVVAYVTVAETNMTSILQSVLNSSGLGSLPPIKLPPTGVDIDPLIQ